MTTTIRSVPGESGLPLIGHVLDFMRDCNQLHDTMHAKYGPVYYNRFINSKAVHLLSPEGNEFVLLDRDDNFASSIAWNRSLGKLFPNGLMLRDGSDHRYHRRLMGAPFKSAALKIYVDTMNQDIAQSVSHWHSQTEFLFYPAVKQLTLDLASKIFLGETLSTDTQKINQAFVDVVAASLVVIRYPMFGNAYQRGLEGRALLEDYFQARIGAKQASNDSDMFAEICRAEGEDGSKFTDKEIIDHMIFLMMAAHDTTTSSLSSVFYALAKHPDWQNQIRDEINAVGDDLDYASMPQLGSVDLVLKETLRMYPPLPIIPRAAIKDCQFDGYQINKGDIVHISPSFTHRMASIWTEPSKFDPERFNKLRAEHKKHRHAWVPFGGGAHKCLGLNFAEMQIKLVLFHVLKQYQIQVPDEYVMPFEPAPIGKPVDMLPLTLTHL